LALKKAVCCFKQLAYNLSTLSTDAAGKLDILGHDGDTLSMDGAQVCVLKESNQVSLRGLLESHDSGGLESEVSLEVLGNLTDKTLEGQLADEKLSGLLVTTDLAESDCARAITMGLLDSSGSGGRLAGSLGGKLLPGGLASGGLASGLLSTGHCYISELSRGNELPSSVTSFYIQGLTTDPTLLFTTSTQ